MLLEACCAISGCPQQQPLGRKQAADNAFMRACRQESLTRFQPGLVIAFLINASLPDLSSRNFSHAFPPRDGPLWCQFHDIIAFSPPTSLPLLSHKVAFLPRIKVLTRCLTDLHTQKLWLDFLFQIQGFSYLCGSVSVFSLDQYHRLIQLKPDAEISLTFSLTPFLIFTRRLMSISPQQQCSWSCAVCVYS